MYSDVKQSKAFLIGLILLLLVIAAVTVMCVGIVVGLYRGVGVLPVWGWASAIPCVVLGVLLIILSYNDRFAAWAERRLFL